MYYKNKHSYYKNKIKKQIEMRNNFQRNQLSSQFLSTKQFTYDYKIQQGFISHMKIMKKLNTSSKAFQRISKSYFDIKTNALLICQVLQSDCFSGISLNLGKTLLQIISQANSSISDHCKQYSNQLYNLMTMYSQLVKQKHEKYKQQKENLQHYIEKVRSLSKNNNQKDRYQRNIDKLKVAKSNYETSSKQVHKLLEKTNQESEKIWQKNFIGFTSIFITKYNQAVNHTKQLIDKDDQLILQEQLVQIQLSSANSFKQQPKIDRLTQQIQKLLNKNRDINQKIALVDVFKLNSKINTLKSQQNLTNVQKLFGISRINDSPPSSTIKKQLAQSNPITIHRKEEPQLNFSFFDNILAEKNQREKNSSNIQKTMSYNINHSKSNQRNKNIQFSLIDL